MSQRSVANMTRSVCPHAASSRTEGSATSHSRSSGPGGGPAVAVDNHMAAQTCRGSARESEESAIATSFILCCRGVSIVGLSWPTVVRLRKHVSLQPGDDEAQAAQALIQAGPLLARDRKSVV